VRDLDANKALAWLSIVVIAITSVVTFSKLFSAVESHETRLAKIEKTNEEREEKQKVRDEALQTTLGKIDKSLDFANWRIGGITDQL